MPRESDERGTTIPRGTVILIGVMAQHDSVLAEEMLDSLVAWLMAGPDMPLLVTHMAPDCLVSPVERGQRHFEIRWIEV